MILVALGLSPGGTGCSLDARGALRKEVDFFRADLSKFPGVSKTVGDTQNCIQQHIFSKSSEKQSQIIQQVRHADNNQFQERHLMLNLFVVMKNHSQVPGYGKVPYRSPTVTFGDYFGVLSHSWHLCGKPLANFSNIIRQIVCVEKGYPRLDGMTPLGQEPAALHREIARETVENSTHEAPCADAAFSAIPCIRTLHPTLIISLNSKG